MQTKRKLRRALPAMALAEEVMCRSIARDLHQQGAPLDSVPALVANQFGSGPRAEVITEFITRSMEIMKRYGL
jgi:hypothetical protein